MCLCLSDFLMRMKSEREVIGSIPFSSTKFFKGLGRIDLDPFFVLLNVSDC